jgi:hypothetical protein
MPLLTLHPTYKSTDKFFKEFNSKKGFPFAGWYLSGERERERERVDVSMERDVLVTIIA